MIEKIVLDYLNDCLPVPCYMEMPRNASGRFCVVEKTGSSVENHIYTATVAIQSYATSMYEAAELNNDVKGMMDLLDYLPEVARCELNSDYNFTDTGMRMYRYQAVFDIVHY